MKKIVVTGASTFGVDNMGDDAMLATMVQGLRRSLPECQIVFLARHPEATYDRVFGFRSIKNLDHDTRQASVGRFFWGMNAGDPKEHLLTIGREIREADLLIIGGNCFMEIAANEFLRGVSSYAATLGTLAKFSGTPFALFGLNVVDEIRDSVTRQHARFLCENATAATLREADALTVLERAGVKTHNMTALGDPAYGMEAVPSDCADRVRPRLHRGKPVLGVSFRHEYWRGDAETFYEIATRFAHVLDRVVELLDVQVLMIPNCTYTHANPWQDDRLTHKTVVERMQRADRVHQIEEQLSVFDTFNLFQLLDLHISNRRHSNVFAAMHCVPFVSLAVEFKGHMQPFLNDLGVPEQIVSLEQPEAVVEKLRETRASSDRLRRQLDAGLRPLIAQAQRHIPVILESVR